MMRSAALATFFGTLGGAQRIAVCFAGETRSLIEWPVVASFSQHIRPTLERVGGYDVFVVLSEDALDDSMRDAITSAYGASAGQRSGRRSVSDQRASHVMSRARDLLIFFAGEEL